MYQFPKRAREARSNITRKIWPYVPIPADVTYARTKFQRFMSDPPLSSFKKLIVSTLRLLCSLFMMSLAKAVLNGLKDRGCKKIALREHPPIPYVSEKDCVQETVSAYKDNHLKTQIIEGMELLVPNWHSDTRNAFLIHVGSA
jgi:hypothetical protein